MKSPKGTRNTNIRNMITKVLTPLPSGAVVTTPDLVAMFTNYRGTTHRNVACLLRERDDVKMVGSMEWMKI